MASEKENIVRAFIAVEIPDVIKAAMREVQDGLRKSGADVGWVRPEGVHLTLKFLGPVEAGRIRGLAAALERAVGGVKSFPLKAKGIGVFPSARAPRVVWLGLEGDMGALSAL